MSNSLSRNYPLVRVQGDNSPSSSKKSTKRQAPPQSGITFPIDMASAHKKLNEASASRLPRPNYSAEFKAIQTKLVECNTFMTRNAKNITFLGDRLDALVNRIDDQFINTETAASTTANAVNSTIDALSNFGHEVNNFLAPNRSPTQQVRGNGLHRLIIK